MKCADFDSFRIEAASRIRVLDTTLREGEQTPGVYFSPEKKVVVAKLLDAVGVDLIEVGNPRVDAEVEDAIRRIAAAGLRARVAVHSRCQIDDVRLALDCGAGFLGTFVSVCDARLERDYRRSFEELVGNVTKVVAFARAQRPEIEIRFTVEDALRCDPARVDCVAVAAARAGADVVSVADTTGVGHPWCPERSVGRSVSRLREALRGERLGAEIEVHCHNDRGLALANALDAVAAGAGVVDATVLGIGERAGIVDLAALLFNLCELAPGEVRWRLERLPELYETVSRFSGLDLPPTAPLLGKHAFTHFAGTHVKAMSKDSCLYQSVDPRTFGRKWRYQLGIQSGRSTVELALQEIGRCELSRDRGAVATLLRQVKDLSRQGVSVTTEGPFMDLVRNLERGPAKRAGEAGRPASAPAKHTVCRPSTPFVAFPREAIHQSIAHRFEEQVRRAGERLAVVSPRGEYTYRELDRRANRLAHAVLRRRGEVPEPVAILASHDINMIVAVIGILKTGKFYVPLDVNLPEARLRQLLRQADCDAIVTDRAHLKLASALTRAGGVFDVDDLSNEVSEACPSVEIAPDQNAYVIFTSGSTGEPKGVVQTQRTTLNNVRNYTNGIHINQDDRLLMLAALSYTASISGMFGALLNGATVAPFDFKRLGFERLAEWIRDREITVYHSVPTVFRHVCRRILSGMTFPKLRLIKLGGDVVTRRDVDLYRKHFSDSCLLHVGLGATEVNVIRQYFLDKWSDFPGPAVPVGYPVDQVHVDVVDDQGQPVGPHEVGEIVIRGRYLSPGYWRRPDLTAAAFETDAHDPAIRTYHSGDMGSMDASGCLTHRGRKDSQVKIRGQRVELAEVESTLMQLASVQHAVVLAWPDSEQERQLVGYVVPGSGERASAAEWRSFLELRLPHFMVPARFLALDEMPLNANGKVDRKLLPSPDLFEENQGKDFVAPDTQVECEICRIWEEVLQRPKVGVADDFFELGGRSILLMQVISRLRRCFGVEIPFKVLLQRPTPRQLACVVEEFRLPEEKPEVPCHVGELVVEEGVL